MKFFISFLVLTVLFAGCDNNKLTQDQINTEKNVIIARIESFIVSYQKKDLSTILSMLSSSNDFLFFGSDLAEIVKSKADFQNQLIQDWKLFESIQFGDLRNVDILISNSGDFANSIFEVPMKAVISETPSSITIRMDLCFLKEDRVWKIRQALVSIPSVGQSSSELVQSEGSKK